jgi:hypothetical protein
MALSQAMTGLLATCMTITVNRARRDWRAIGGRTPQARYDFLPVETLLCQGLFFHRIRPRRYGGRNMHSLPPEAHLLAATLGRTPASLVYKMHNLEGSLKHGQNEEPLLFIRLSRDPNLYATLYSAVIEAARIEGFGASRFQIFWVSLDFKIALSFSDRTNSEALKSISRSPSMLPSANAFATHINWVTQRPHGSSSSEYAWGSTDLLSRYFRVSDWLVDFVGSHQDL